MAEIWTYEDANTIRVVGDLTSKYHTDQLIKLTQDETVKYFLVRAVALGDGDTLLTVSGGGVYALANSAITSPFLATGAYPADLPAGFPIGNVVVDGICIQSKTYGARLSANPYSYAFLMLRPGAANTGAILDLVPHPTLAAGNATAALNLYLTDWSADQTNFEALNLRAQDNEFGIIIDAHGTGSYRDFLINNAGYNLIAVRANKIVELLADSYFDTNLRLNGKMAGQKSIIEFWEDTTAKAKIVRYGSAYGSGLDDILEINQISNAAMRFMTNNTERARIDADGTVNIVGSVVSIGGHKIAWATAAPSTGTWARGDVCHNSEPSAGGTPGWVCTEAGSPGTWKAMANLAS